MRKLIIIAALLYSMGAAATNYYVSNAGSDSNNGTSTATPWASLTKVNAGSFVAGDSILFRRGDTFYGSFTTIWSGNSTSSIVFAAYGTGANPIISGFTSVSAWTNLGSNIWESTSSVSSLTFCNMLTIGGVNMPMGRYPKVTAANKGYLTFQTSSGYTSLTSSDLTGSPDWSGAEVVIRSQAFHLKRSFVTAQSTSTLTFGSIGETMSAGNGFFFQNDIRCCTQQNEWFYNATTGKVRIYSTSQPSNVKLSTVENLVTINSNYLVFKNLQFIGANSNAMYCWDHSPRYHHVKVKNCTFNQNGVTGIYVLINYLTVSGSTFSDINATAIETSFGANDSILNNTVTKIGLFHGMRNNKTYTMANGTIDCGNVAKWTVLNNKITNVGFNGISCWASDTVHIQYNYVDTFCSVIDDGGGIYLFAATGSAYHYGRILNNVCLNGIAAVEGSTFVHHAHGVYLDQGTGNILVYKNSCSNNTGSGIYVTSAGNNIIRENVCFNNTESQFTYQYFGGTAPIPTGDVINKNTFVAKTNGSGSLDYQKCLYIYYSDTTKYRAAFSADSNYYARPYAETTVVFVNAGFPNWLKTLAAWKAFSGKDAHSDKSYQAVTSLADFQFEFNPTSTTKTVTLTQAMIDIKGTKYTGNITLQPFSSMVMLKDYNPAPVVTGGRGKCYIRMGKQYRYRGKIYVGR
jgi:parallel beta-helix repeat (two copies)